MLVSELRNFIKTKKIVSITDITMHFDIEIESLDMPLKILIEKDYIKSSSPIKDTNSNNKCAGCPMTCKQKEQENCSPAPSFKIYTWIKN